MELEAASRAGAPFRWVVDASHPFATRISAELGAACAGALQPLLRLERPCPSLGSALLLGDLAALESQDSAGVPLLLAIGARRLAEAVSHSPLAIHHCRILPHPEALRQAMAAGLAAQRVACLRPGRDGAIERALCQQWGIRTVLCRQSGGPTEGHWRTICQHLGLRLLLLQRPAEPTGPMALSLESLVEQLGWPGPGP
jgi:precorrin-6A/cobalt-precorrin-6A reductase